MKMLFLKKFHRVSLALFLLLVVAVPQRISASTTAMIFCNGDMGSVNGLTPSQINGLRASGMTTMVVFTMGVAANGDFTYGGVICSNGVYVGPSNWGTLLNQCRAQPSSITRIEMCIGAWGDPSWTHIKDRIAADGFGADSVLYRNLVALKNALGIDAICNDDESAYHSASAIQFGQMCGAAGLKLTLCPYTNPTYWSAVKAGLGDICDQVYLQCYDGGAGNNPATWNTYFDGLKVIPGYWDWERDTTFLTKMQAGKNAGCTGGFYWPSCTGCNPPADANGMKQYADWILKTFNPVVRPVTAADVVGSAVIFTADFAGSDLSYQWKVIRGGVTNDIPGATSSRLTLANLQLSNTASYFVVASNASGISASSMGSLTVTSVPSAVNGVVASYAAQTGLGSGISFSPTWTLSLDSIISGQAPSITNGNFNLETFGGGRDVRSLTRGDTLTISQTGGVTSTNYVTCGNGGGAGFSVIYTLTNSSAGGYNLTNITVYGGWKDAGRDQQAYTVYYSKVSAPETFITLRSVSFNPVNPTGAPSATRSTLTASSGALATNVAAVRFNFNTPASENGYCGYAEIQLFGVPISPKVVSDTVPATASDVVGSEVSFTAQIASANPLVFQWEKISGGITNEVPGATNSILTLTNLQLSDTGSYRLRATNGFGMAVSKASSLTVSSLPAPLNNILTTYAAQTGLGSAATNFVPTWNVRPGSLIAGNGPSNVGTGDFGLYGASSLVAVLADGSFGWLNFWPNIGGSPSEVTCGTSAGGAGQSVTYTLSDSTDGYTLTNIVVYGGWGDAGRDQQAYTIYYSTTSSPATFLPLSSVNFNPANPLGVQSATRATLTPVNGVLATNVAAVKFDFTAPPPENGFCGYSEIAIYGFPSLPPAMPALLSANPKTGSDFILNVSGLIVGRNYILQSSTNLSSNDWIMEAEFVATQSGLALTNATDASSEKFFRVLGF